MSENWYIVTRRNHDRFEVWIDEEQGSTISPNAIVVGQGSTRSAALADASRELLDLASKCSDELAEINADAERGLQRYRETAEAVDREALQRAQTARGATNESQFGGRP